jgi:hypothetical protein
VWWPLTCDRRARKHTTTAASMLSSSDPSLELFLTCRLLLALRTSFTLVDELLARAKRLCGPLERSVLLREVLQALRQRKSAKRLAALGVSAQSGCDPDLEPVPWRRIGPCSWQTRSKAASRRNRICCCSSWREQPERSTLLIGAEPLASG